MAMSSKLSQSKVGGMSVVEFLGVIFVPVGNFDDDVGGAVGNGLAAETRLWRDAGCFIEFIEFGVSGIVAGFQALLDDDVAGGTGADSAAGVIKACFERFGKIENAARQAVVTVGNFFRIDFQSFAAGQKRDLEFLRCRLVLYFVDVWVTAAHLLSSVQTNKRTGLKTRHYKNWRVQPGFISQGTRDENRCLRYI